MRLCSCSTQWVLLTLLVPSQWVWPSQVSAQTFSRRYDLSFAQNILHKENGVAILSDGGSGYVLFLNASRQDSVTEWFVMTLHIDSAGVPLDTTVVTHPSQYLQFGSYAPASTMASGGYCVAGSYDHNVVGGSTALFLFDQTGALDTLIEYEVPGEMLDGHQALETPDGGYIISGKKFLGPGDPYLLKLAPDGGVLWYQVYPDGHLIDAQANVALGPDGGFLIGSQEYVNGIDPFVLRTDSLGAQIWGNSYGMPYIDHGAHISGLKDGNYVFASAWAPAYQSTPTRNCLVKIDTAGSVLWSHMYGPVSSGPPGTLPSLKTVRGAGSGNLIAAGYSLYFGHAGLLLKTAANGDSIWMRYYNYSDTVFTAAQGMFVDVLPTLDGGFIAIGTADNEVNGTNHPGTSKDAWVLRVDSLGCLEPGCDLITGLVSQAVDLPNALSISPNPTSGSVLVSWELPASLRRKGGAELVMVSLSGGVVNRFSLDGMEAGTSLNVSHLAPGLYHVHLVQQGVWLSGAKLVVE